MEKDKKQKKALVTSRVLFYSVLDKILFVVFSLDFVYGLIFGLLKKGKTITNVFGYYSCFLIVMVLLALLLNWIYKCATKTMLCITEDEVYKEAYAPLKRSEMSIPLSKITSVTTFNFCWIFRSIIIFQYHQLPVIFFTWNNQEFKDKFDELVNGRKEKISNEYEDKNVISFISKKNYILFGSVFCGLLVLFLIIAIILSFISPSSRAVGTYVNDSNEITLNKDLTCNISYIDDVKKCNWKFDEDNNRVVVNYTQEIKLFSSTKEKEYSMTFDYKDKALNYGSKTYSKK